MTRITYHHIRIGIDGDDEGGLLAMVDGRVVALFTHLTAEFHGDVRGCWHHEFGFGRHDGRPGVFETVDDITRWILARRGSTEADLDGPVEFWELRAAEPGEARSSH